MTTWINFCWEKISTCVMCMGLDNKGLKLTTQTSLSHPTIHQKVAKDLILKRFNSVLHWLKSEVKMYFFSSQGDNPWRVWSSMGLYAVQLWASAYQQCTRTLIISSVHLTRNHLRSLPSPFVHWLIFSYPLGVQFTSPALLSSRDRVSPQNSSFFNKNYSFLNYIILADVPTFDGFPHHPSPPR